MEIQQATSNTSPTREFSFTNSLNSSSTPNPLPIDLMTPADEIFFHGQLLPLHLLSNDHFSPRVSTNSFDDFIPPRRNLLVNDSDKSIGHSFNSYEYNTNNRNGEFLSKAKAKSKSFSLLRRRSKEGEIGEAEDQSEKIKKKKRRFYMGHFLKKYIRISTSSNERREDIQFRKKPYSFSGKMSLRDLRGRRAEFSSPASMRTSPSNSGILMADSRATLHHSNDSSMEELQAAIQAAIAHCKNSIAIADNKAMVS